MKRHAYSRRRLVENEQLAPPDDRTSEREDLSLPDRKVPAAARNLGIEGDGRYISLAL